MTVFFRNPALLRRRGEGSGRRPPGGIFFSPVSSYSSTFFTSGSLYRRQTPPSLNPSAVDVLKPRPPLGLWAPDPLVLTDFEPVMDSRDPLLTPRVVPPPSQLHRFTIPVVTIGGVDFFVCLKEEKKKEKGKPRHNPGVFYKLRPPRFPSFYASPDSGATADPQLHPPTPHSLHHSFSSFHFLITSPTLIFSPSGCF